MVKDKVPLKYAELYKISGSCGRCYIGQTKIHISTFASELQSAE